MMTYRLYAMPLSLIIVKLLNNLYKAKLGDLFLNYQGKKMTAKAAQKTSSLLPASVPIKTPKSPLSTTQTDQKKKAFHSTSKTKKNSKNGASEKGGTSEKNLGSRRGIETMFRNSYRAQLELISLSATKANIMISLNGIILSALTISGPFILVQEPLFSIPLGIFTATCLLAIIFAVLAARPQLVKTKPTLEDFQKDIANPLVFEEYAKLSADEHLSVMQDMMLDNRRVYDNMSRQLYHLGKTANHKFKLLHIAYSIFMGGLTLSTITLLVIGAMYNMSIPTVPMPIPTIPSVEIP